MKLDLLPIFQTERGMKNYLVTNFRRIQDLFSETDAYKTPPAADPWHLIGAAGEPAFQNGWTNYGGGYGVAAFRKTQNDRVELRGLITAGSMGVPFVQLPVGYRPTLAIHMMTFATDASCGVRVYNDGSINLGGPSPSNSYVSVEFTFALGQG